MWNETTRIKALNHATKKVLYFDGIKEAAEATGVSQAYVKRSLNEPGHYSHYPDEFHEINTRGLNRLSKPEWAFSKEAPILVSLIPTWEGDDVQQDFTAHYQAYKMLGISTSTYYRKRMLKHETIQDMYGREWIVIWHK